MFDQEAEEKLKANPDTTKFFKDPDFRKRFAMVRRNPNLLGDLLQKDPRFLKVLNTLSGVEEGLSVSERLGMSEEELAARSENLFNEDAEAKLKAHPAPSSFFNDPQFVASHAELQANPNRLGEMLKKDPRFLTALQVLTNDPSVNKDGSGVFGKNAEEKLKAHEETAKFFEDPKFVENFDKVQQDPLKLIEMMQTDPRFNKVLQVLTRDNDSEGSGFQES